MIYQPSGYLQIRAAVKESNGAFTFARYLRLPSQIYNDWIDPYPGGMLRERYALPLLSQYDLKPGYHWSEMVH